MCENLKNNRTWNNRMKNIKIIENKILILLISYLNRIIPKYSDTAFVDTLKVKITAKK